MKKIRISFCFAAVLGLTAFLASCEGNSSTNISTTNTIPTIDPGIPSSTTTEYIDNAKAYIKLTKNGSSTVEYGEDDLACEVYDKDGVIIADPSYNSVFVIDEAKYNEYITLATNKARQEWLLANATHSMDFSSVTTQKPGKYYTFISLINNRDTYYTNPTLINIAKKDITIQGITDDNFYAEYSFPTDEALDKIKLSDITDDTNYQRIHLGDEVEIPGLAFYIGHFEFKNPNEEIDCTNSGETRKIKFVLNEDDPSSDWKLNDYYTSNKEYDIKLKIEKGKVEVPQTNGYNLDDMNRYYNGKEYNIITDEYPMISLGNDKDLFTVEGDTSKNNVGDYQVKLALKNTTNYEWGTPSYPEHSPEPDNDNELVFNWKIIKNESNINEYLYRDKHFVTPSGTWIADDVYKLTYTDLTSPFENEEYKIIPESNEIEFYIAYDENLVLASQYKFIIEKDNNDDPFYGYPFNSGFTYHFENETVTPADGKISNKIILDTVGTSNYFDIRFSMEAVPDDNISGGSSQNGQLITVKKLITNRSDILANIKPNEYDEYGMQLPVTLYSTLKNNKNMITIEPSTFLKDTTLGTTNGKYLLEVQYDENYESRYFRAYLGEKTEVPDGLFNLTVWFNRAKVYYCHTVNGNVDSYTEILSDDTLSVTFKKRLPERTQILATIKDSSETNPIVINTLDYHLEPSNFIDVSSYSGHYVIFYDTNSCDMTLNASFELYHGQNETTNYYDGNVHKVTIKYIPYNSYGWDELYETLTKDVYVELHNA